MRLLKAFGFVAALALTAPLLVACDEPEPQAQAPVPTVRAVTVTSAVAPDVRYTGVVHARTESDLGFRVPGKIAERLVDPGDRVVKGQPLLRLDETDFALAVQAAEAAVEAARAENARALADEARQRKLLDKGWVATQAYDRAKEAADAARANLQRAEAQAQQVVNQADYAVLKADADGVVMAVPADVGQVVAAGQTVVRLAQDGAREALVNLPETAVQSATNSATATLYAAPDQRFPALLRELSAVADPATRTYQARYTLTGAGQDAPLGATVTIHLAGLAGSAAARFEAPVGALYDNGGGPAVWVIDPATSTVALRPVQVLRLGEETVEIAGLEPGERIVALGAHLLQPGEKVRVAAEAVAALAPPALAPPTLVPQ